MHTSSGQVAAEGFAALMHVYHFGRICRRSVKRQRFLRKCHESARGKFLLYRRLSWGRLATVLEPQELRQRVAAEARGMLERVEGGRE